MYTGFHYRNPIFPTSFLWQELSHLWWGFDNLLLLKRLCIIKSSSTESEASISFITSLNVFIHTKFNSEFPTKGFIHSRIKLSLVKRFVMSITAWLTQEFVSAFRTLGFDVWLPSKGWANWSATETRVTLFLETVCTNVF